MKKKGFTLIELLVVIAIIAMLLAILMPALSKVKKIAQRVVCGTNLKGLGTAQTVYANDYEDRYTVQLYNGTTPCQVNDRTAQWQDPLKNWNTGGFISVGASLYLLVREADVSPKSFVCPSSAEKVYDGQNTANLDITELWDFGHPLQNNTGPTNCLSYSYHNPYNRFSADGSRGAAFAVMADKNPYFDAKLTFGAVTPQNVLDRSGPLIDDWSAGTPVPQKFQIQRANSQPHGRDGQNVVFGDGHSSFEKRPDVGVQHDNIYTVYATNSPVTPSDLRIGLTPPLSQAANFPTSDPRGNNDSYLINDTRRP